MFDLIDESGKELKKYGYKVKSVGKYEISVASLKITDNKKALELGLRQGDFYIITSPFLHELGKNNEIALQNIIQDKLKALLKQLSLTKKDRFLLACLGNFDIEGDRLGKEVFDNIKITSMQGNNNLFKFCPNIFLFTGVETASIVKMFVKELKIDCVIIIDSLTTSSISRLGVSFQLCTGGMTPGSGVNRFGKVIAEDDIGAKCISIGVPFIINATSLNSGTSRQILLVPKDITNNINRAGRVIAGAINEVLT